MVMTDATKAGRERPLSPFVSVWRWHITMAASIAHRVTGVALYVAALIAAAWAISLASGPDAYAAFKAVMASPIGLVVMFGLTVSFFYHLANGVRHLVWDTGRGFDIKTANASAVLVIAFALAASIAIWVIAAMTGAI
ncbi:succinate dehydrogenase, cytochrome b556 subunit [Phenylobacterium sp.]|uniref:succinate dehydrogenase, cytochrome b556 subunit n=1 Tax=Phenylobacterium sp. TaxID=1871053 RepID=UPI00260B3515|nr:succinate dehydrogenase, cytochrome b556 subunit [Phenylobacterium sp.]